MENPGFLKFYKNEEVKNLSLLEFESLVECYAKVFNESFPEEKWTFTSAKKYINESFKISRERKLALTLVKNQDSVVGFSWINITDPHHILPIDLPNNLDKKEIDYAIEVITSWSEMSGHERIVIFRETAILKEFRIINKRHTSSALHIPLYEYAQKEGCTILFYWTNYFGSGFKLGIQVGWHPIIFFPKKNRVIIKGGVENCLKYLAGISGKEKWVFEAMRKNTQDYFIQRNRPKEKK
jgi:hypothetical protein